MNCMKCGRETGADQAFCPQCLELAEKCPVRSDVVIRLPDRREAPHRRAQPRKRTRTPEEQIYRLKRINHHLITAVCILLLSTILLTTLSIDIFRQLDVQRFLGQNYSTVETTD